MFIRRRRLHDIMGLFPKPPIEDAIVLVLGFIAVLIFLGGSTKARGGILQFLSFEIQLNAHSCACRICVTLLEDR